MLAWSNRYIYMHIEHLTLIKTFLKIGKRFSFI